MQAYQYYYIHSELITSFMTSAIIFAPRGSIEARQSAGILFDNKIVYKYVDYVTSMHVWLHVN